MEELPKVRIVYELTKEEQSQVTQNMIDHIEIPTYKDRDILVQDKDFGLEFIDNKLVVTLNDKALEYTLDSKMSEAAYDFTAKIFEKLVKHKVKVREKDNTKKIQNYELYNPKYRDLIRNGLISTPKGFEDNMKLQERIKQQFDLEEHIKSMIDILPQEIIIDKKKIKITIEPNDQISDLTLGFENEKSNYGPHKDPKIVNENISIKTQEPKGPEGI